MCEPGRLLEVDGEAALVAVEIAEEPGSEAGEPPRRIALGRRLDLDDVGAEIGEHQPGARPHDGLGEFEDAQSRERQRGGGIGIGHGGHGSARFRGFHPGEQTAPPVYAPDTNSRIRR